jgi:hypothetical protein
MFSYFRFLKWICIPASVEVISDGCFADLRQLSSLTFEPGSKLREIRTSVFFECDSLRSISLPASLSVLTGSAFIGSSIQEIHVDRANDHCFVSGESLIGLQGMTLIFHFGPSERVIVGAELGSFGKYREIGPYSFVNCSVMRSIYIPASIEILGDSCFGRCSSLFQITFESGSKLTRIGQEPFQYCSSLTIICIPVQVEDILSCCFHRCGSLAEITFELNSSLLRIGSRAFSHCRSLSSIILPSQIEMIDSTAFYACAPLRQLIVGMDSQLRALDLPPADFGSLFVPDSV